MTASEDDHSAAGSAATGRVPIWERLERPPRAPRATLTHDQIAKAAVELADAEGLGAVSMRRLADRLGVSPMALYRYVTSKDELFELMLDAAYADITLPQGPSADWRVVARSYAQQARVVTLRHPWLIRVSAELPGALTPNLLALTEQALTAVEGLLENVDEMMAVFGVINAFVRGAAMTEVTQLEFRQRHGFASDEEVRVAYRGHARWLLGTGRYPTLARYIIEGSDEDDAQTQFEFGLECVLDGIAARLKL